MLAEASSILFHREPDLLYGILRTFLRENISLIASSVGLSLLVAGIAIFMATLVFDPIL